MRIFPGFPAFDAAVAASDYSGSFKAVWSEQGVSPEQVAEYCISCNWPPPQTPGNLGRALKAGTVNSLQQALQELQNAVNTAFSGCVIGGGDGQFGLCIMTAPLVKSPQNQRLLLNDVTCAAGFQQCDSSSARS